MNTKVHKVGNSLSIYISKRVAEKVGLVRGMPVRVRPAGRKIVVELEGRRETLQDLLKDINPHQLRPLIDFGPDVGEEVIG